MSLTIEEALAKARKDLIGISRRREVVLAMLAAVEAANDACYALYSAHEADPYIISVIEADRLDKALNTFVKTVEEAT